MLMSDCNRRAPDNKQITQRGRSHSGLKILSNPVLFSSFSLLSNRSCCCILNTMFCWDWNGVGTDGAW